MRDISLLTGPVPVGFQITVAALIGMALGVRTRSWRRHRLPVVLAAGIAGGLGARAVSSYTAAVPDDAPPLLWWWLGSAVACVAAVVVGWSSARWWRRSLSGLVVPLCLLCAALVANQWTGYLATPAQAWRELTNAPVPHQVALDDLLASRSRTAEPSTGQVVGVDIDGPSGFRHRQELVYLPPAWFRSPAVAPRLPVLMMVGAELSAPADWIRAGAAASAADRFAAAHDGVAPIMVFVDPAGGPTNDTECVDGAHGRAAAHLVDDVRPFVMSRFQASPDPRRWGVVGWSMGGTCAVGLAVTHPELFSTFHDISGDVGPNIGTTAQTIERLFRGDREAWARFDPLTVLARHGPYGNVAGRFDTARDGRGAADELTAARRLCDAAAARAITCEVTARPGKHNWQHAAASFADALPWLTARTSGAVAPLSRGR